MGIIAKDEVRRKLINGLLIVLLVFIIVPSIPPMFLPVRVMGGEMLLDSIQKAISPYALHLGLLETWAMFAPDPARQNTYVDAEITYRNGQKYIWTFPQMQELGYAERYAKERYRKFANERLWVKEQAMLWPDAARYIARLNANPSNPPRVVRLAHHWSVIPPPSLTDEPAPERWRHDVFFTYNVKAGDLQ